MCLLLILYFNYIELNIVEIIIDQKDPLSRGLESRP
jgi:hypothetical protein